MVRWIACVTLSFVAISCSEASNRPSGDVASDEASADAGDAISPEEQLERTRDYTVAMIAGNRSDAPCVWGVDAVLEHLSIEATMRHDCGRFPNEREVAAALSCLSEADRNAEVTLNRCIDCFVHSIYVVTARGDAIHVRLEDDALGDPFREVSVDRCEAFQKDDLLGIRCVQPETLYTCWDSRTSN